MKEIHKDFFFLSKKKIHKDLLRANWEKNIPYKNIHFDQFGKKKRKKIYLFYRGQKMSNFNNGFMNNKYEAANP